MSRGGGKLDAAKAATSRKQRSEIRYQNFKGATCGADVINARIEFAKVLMAETDLNITEISGRCGNESVIHFSRQFKKMTGVAPSEYRKKYRKN